MGCMGGVVGGVQGERAVTEGSITATFVVRTVLFGMGLGICHSDGFSRRCAARMGCRVRVLAFPNCRLYGGMLAFAGPSRRKITFGPPTSSLRVGSEPPRVAEGD